MASKVLVNLPSVPFGISQSSRHQNLNMDRVAQLEQNMKFLQEQHQATLVALHQEVESLRQKNRDLQFQLVFSKGSNYVPSSPSSPEDNGNGFMKSKGSPVCVNIAPLQVELLEKDLQDTKISLQEAKTQNQYLSDIIEEQKKKLNTVEEQKTKKQTAVADVGIQVGSRLVPVGSDLVQCLEFAQGVIKRLKEQKEDELKEFTTSKAALENTASCSKRIRPRDSNNSHHSRGSPPNAMQEQTPHKFPPLQRQSSWHRKTPRNGRNRHDKQQQDHQSEMDSTVLPQLQNGNAKPDTVNYKSPFYRPRGYRNYYRDENNRKYRGQMPQKDRRDTDNNHHHRRDYKDRNSKDHQKEFTDSAEGSREGDNSGTASKS